MLSSLAFLISAIVPQPQLLTGFIENGAEGSYWAGGKGFTASFDGDGIVLKQRERRIPIRFPGARLRWQSLGEPAGSMHRIGVGSWKAYSSLRAQDALPGVDILFLQSASGLKSEFHLNPGIRPDTIRYCFENAKPRIGPHGGSLIIDPSLSEVGLRAWQLTADGEKKPLRIRYRVNGACVTFEAKGLNPNLATVVDPDYAFSTYLGGGLFDAITSVATDAAGNVYLGGWTESTDYPNVAAYQPVSAGRIDGFIAKISPTGQLLYSTFLGGALEDRVQGIALDSVGNIIVTGHTTSANFPLLAPASGALSGGRDAFLAKLNPSGSALIFSTFLGGTSHDMAWSVAVDSNNVIAIAGETASANFPVLLPLQSCSGADGFISRLSISGVLISSTCIGGSGDDRIRAIAFGPDGLLHATGATLSSNFPTVSPVYSFLNGGMDAFYARYSNAVNTTLFSTYLGGSGGTSTAEESGYGIRVTEANAVWIAGSTSSTNFPATATGFQPSYGGGITDGFVAVFSGNTHQWSSYLGGSAVDGATAVAVAPGSTAIAGYTTSPNLPLQSPLQAARAGDYDAFWALFSSSSRTPLYVSYLGGSGADSAAAVANGNGAVTVAGSTLSNNFPLVNLVQAVNAGSFGGFATRIRFGSAPLSISPIAGSGNAATFVVTYSDVEGATSIANAHFMVNSQVSNDGGCYVVYNRPANTLSLYRDHLASWVAQPLGTGGTLDSNQCSVAMASASVTISGQTLTLTLPVTFKPGFGGTRNLYASAVNNAGMGSGFSPMGAWNVTTPAAPTVTSVTPSSGTGYSQAFTFAFSDTNGGADIASATVNFNTSTSTSGGCYLSWSRAAGTVSLWNDTTQTWFPLAIGSSSNVENGRCTLNGLGLSVTTTTGGVTLTLPLTFGSSMAGTRTIYASAADAGGLTSGLIAAGSWTILAQTSPSIGSFTPLAGTGAVTNAVLTISDLNGAADLSLVSILVNGPFSTTNGCLIQYNRPSNLLALYRDADQTWLTTAPGSGPSVENVNCSIAGATSSIAISGNSLTLSVAISYKPVFGGTKNIWAAATDSVALTTGWVPVGTWNPSVANGPVIGTLTPAAGSGSSPVFTVTVSDPNGSSDIGHIGLLINSTLATAGGCYLVLDRSQDSIFLFRDSDQSWLTVRAGSPRTIENTNCAISGSGVRIDSSGSAASWVMPVTFKPAFSGAKSVYASALDLTGILSGWQQVGSWSP